MDKMIARQMVETLSKGINPLIGTCLPDTDVCANEQMQEALETVLEACNIPTTKQILEQAKEEKLVELRKRRKVQHKKYPNAGQPWTKAEKKQLLLLNKTHTISGISKILKRSPSAIKSKLQDLGELPKATYFRY